MKWHFFPCAALLLLGCSVPQQTPASPIEQTTQLTLAVTDTSSPAAETGIRVFCEQVAQLSKGSMQVEVRPAADFLTILDEDIDLLWCANAEVASANGDFLAFSSPYFFADYLHLTLTLNAKQFQAAIAPSMENLLHAQPLAAFYGGNQVFLSTREQHTFDVTEAFAHTRFGTIADPVQEYLFRMLGAEIRVRTEGENLEAFGKGRDRAITCSTLRLAQLEQEEEEKELFVCESFHRAEIDWLLLLDATAATLTDAQRAILTEATAFALSAQDEEILASEDAGRQHLEEMGASFLSLNRSELLEAVSQILRQSPRFGGLWNWEQYREIQALVQG